MPVQLCSLEKKEQSESAELQRGEFHTVCTGMNVVDFTAFKITKISKHVSDAQHKETLGSLLRDYALGITAIAWKRGKILWKKIDTND